MTADFVIQTRALSKRFFAVQALDNVDVAVRQGEIHALVGENGAGKSTLGKVISGILRPDSGDLIVKGRTVAYASPRAALVDGITTITQEISLSGKQTVLQNVLLGQEDSRGGVLDFRKMQRRFDDIRNLTGFEIDPQARVNSLRMADQKKVEVMQAIAREAQVVIMDEPTAMLSGEETALFLKTVRHLKSMGLTIIYVSHFLREVLDLADTVTIMRNGQVVRTAPTRDETVETLVTAMLGKSVAQMYPPKAPPAADAPIALEVRDLQSAVFMGVNLRLRAGEILGLAGLVGSGRSRLVRTLFGAEDISGGAIVVDDVSMTPKTPQDAIRAGLYMLPESRKEQGLLLKQSVQLNITLPHLREVATFGGVINSNRELGGIGELIKALDIRVGAPTTRIRNLSGGNQQKALFGKWLFKRPKVLIIDEPTRGIDVGAKQAIYELIVRLASEGMAILMVSSEIEEILGLCHRVLVMHRGKIVTELAAADGTLTEDNIMRAAFGTEAAQRVEG
ncbi:MAG: sugar ABC transporter ATP-binding protein [Chloroflexota bacterium]|nr:sugar ABC transporter ATP-binding protein [Chloroflexota bacterium]